jgi:hypothetical protein
MKKANPSIRLSYFKELISLLRKKEFRRSEKEKEKIRKRHNASADNFCAFLYCLSG